MSIARLWRAAPRPAGLLQKLRNRSKRVRNAADVLVVAASNVLPFRLCQTLRQGILQVAGVKISGRCRIRGPIYIQYPRQLTIGAGSILNGHIHFENAAPIESGADCAIGRARCSSR